MSKFSNFLIAIVCVSLVNSTSALADSAAIAQSKPESQRVDLSGASRPVVYLTFDDGPSADGATEDLLELLAYYGASATFFVTGQRARKEPQKIAAILYAGHAIGNHTHSHVVLTNESESEIEAEFSKANDAVMNSGGPPLTCYRAPFGLTDHVVKRVAGRLAMESVNWSVDTRDWDSNVDHQAILNTLDQIVNGSIVLMHDGPIKRSRTVSALSEWLGLHAHRFQFDVLPQCKPYGASEFFAAVDEQEVDLPLESEDIPSLIIKLRSYRFDFQLGGNTEQVSASSVYKEFLASRIF